MIEVRYNLDGFDFEKQLNLVLYEPQIPPNTGNVARLSAATGSALFLIGKLGFELKDKYLKRAGLDYWPKVKLFHLPTIYDLWETYPRDRFYLVSTKAKISYTKPKYRLGDFLVFGSETKGLPPEFLIPNLDRGITIPMPGNIRCINLSASVAIVTYEALRQIYRF